MKHCVKHAPYDVLTLPLAPVMPAGGKVCVLPVAPEAASLARPGTRS